jgi:hypothetical protein
MTTALTEVIKLTKECSAAILNISPAKKNPGFPTIDCSIRDQYFNNALCDIGASVSVLPKAVFDKLHHSKLVPTSMCLQLANQSIRYPIGITEDIPVKIREFFMPVTFWYWTCNQIQKYHSSLGDPF